MRSIRSLHSHVIFCRTPRAMRSPTSPRLYAPRLKREHRFHRHRHIPCKILAVNDVFSSPAPMPTAIRVPFWRRRLSYHLLVDIPGPFLPPIRKICAVVFPCLIAVRFSPPFVPRALETDVSFHLSLRAPGAPFKFMLRLDRVCSRNRGV